MRSVPRLFLCSCPCGGVQSDVAAGAVVEPLRVGRLKVGGIAEFFRAGGLLVDVEFSGGVAVEEIIADVGGTREDDGIVCFADTEEKIIRCLKISLE